MFNNYKDALKAGDGDKAISYLDERTFQHMDTLIGWVKTASKDETAALDYTDRFYVFSIRHSMTKAMLGDMDGKAFLAFAYNIGLINGSQISQLSIDKIRMRDNGNMAKVELEFRGEDIPIWFHAYKTNDTWKINFASMFKGMEELMRMARMANQYSYQSDNSFMFSMLTRMSGEAPKNKVWYPIE